MHYTSVPNIMKVIGPLFLDDLREEFEKAKDSKTKLQRLWKRISSMKFFDPACGSGNFLIIAYKEIRKLEMEIIAALEALGAGQSELYLPQITLDQFYGIEIDDFAHEVATLSLWLAEHQMNIVFRERFDRVQPYLPLKQAGHIVCGNAARLDWQLVCPAGSGRRGLRHGQSPLSRVLGAVEGAEGRHGSGVFAGTAAVLGSLDYIAILVLQGRRVHSDTHASPMRLRHPQAPLPRGAGPTPMASSTRSPCEIAFAHRPFKWTNRARGQAGVTRRRGVWAAARPWDAGEYVVLGRHRGSSRRYI